MLFLQLPLAAAAGAQETGAIEGRVLSPAGEAASGVAITLPNLGRRTTSADDGTFRFDDIPLGTHLLRAEGERARALEAVSVRSGEPSEITLELSLTSHFEEMVVTGSADARSTLELASATTVLGGDELQRRLQSSLGETLEQEAGISSTFFGPGASRPVIRGQSGDRIAVLEGGMGGGDVSAISPDHAVSVDPAQAEQIEVLRGPATLLYGSSAIGGAVNVVDQRIPTYRASKPLSGTLDLRGGTVASERNGSVGLDGGGGAWAWHAGALARETDDYDIPGHARVEEEHEEEEGEEEDNPFGTVPNTAMETESLQLGVSRFFGDAGFLGVSVSGFDTLYGIPGGAHEHAEEEGEHEGEGEAEEEETVRVDMKQRRFDLRAERMRAVGPFRGFKIRVAASDYEHAELEGDEVGTTFFNDYLEGRFELVQRERGSWTGASGAQISDRELEAIGAEAVLPPTATGRWALFTFQEIVRGALRWQLGARYESQSADVESTSLSDRDHDGLSASAGLVWDASERWSLAVSTARAVKMPAPEELYSNGLHVATQAFEIGDPSLDEESSLGLDVSLRRTAGRITGELTLFRNAFDGYVFPAFTGAEMEGFPVVRYTQNDADFTGAELSARVELLDREAHHLHLRLIGDTVKAELDGGAFDGDNLPRIPAARLGAGLHYHGGALNGMVELRRVFDQDNVASNETPTDGYTFINASVGYRFTFGERLLDVLLRGRNLTDQEARSHTSFLKEFAPLPGRDVSLSVRWWF